MSTREEDARAKKKRRIPNDVIEIETLMLAQRVVAEIARLAFVRGFTVQTLAEAAGVSPDKVLAFMLDPENADVAMIARLSHAMGLRWSMRMDPQPDALRAGLAQRGAR